MALIAYQNSSAKGATITFAAASGGGDTIRGNDRGVLLVRNDDDASVNVTVVTPGNDKYGQARPDLVKAVAAGATAAFGPFPTDLADPSDKLVDITYSAVTDLFVAAVAI